MYNKISNIDVLGRVKPAPEEFENSTITGHFGFVFEKNSGEETS